MALSEKKRSDSVFSLNSGIFSISNEHAITSLPVDLQSSLQSLSVSNSTTFSQPEQDEKEISSRDKEYGNLRFWQPELDIPLEDPDAPTTSSPKTHLFADHPLGMPPTHAPTRLPFTDPVSVSKSNDVSLPTAVPLPKPTAPQATPAPVAPSVTTAPAPHPQAAKASSGSSPRAVKTSTSPKSSTAAAQSTKTGGGTNNISPKSAEKKGQATHARTPSKDKPAAAAPAAKAAAVKAGNANSAPAPAAKQDKPAPAPKQDKPAAAPKTAAPAASAAASKQGGPRKPADRNSKS